MKAELVRRFLDNLPDHIFVLDEEDVVVDLPTPVDGGRHNVTKGLRFPVALTAKSRMTEVAAGGASTLANIPVPASIETATM